MAKKEGGFSFGSIVMMVILYNVFFGSNDEEKKDVEGDKSSLKVKITAKVDEIKSDPEIKELIDNAKSELEEVTTMVSEKIEKKNEKLKKEQEVDKFDDSDDLYGSSEDIY